MKTSKEIIDKISDLIEKKNEISDYAKNIGINSDNFSYQMTRVHNYEIQIKTLKWVLKNK